MWSRKETNEPPGEVSVKKFVGAPWRDAWKGKGNVEERSLIAVAPFGKHKEKIRVFLEANGVVSSRLLQIAFEEKIFDMGRAPYPLEAYVAEAVRYLETLDKVEQEMALCELGDVCGIVGKLCEVVLHKHPTESLMNLRPDSLDAPRRATEGYQGHVYALGVELWKARGHTVNELLGTKGEAWLTGGENIICADGFNTEDYACLRSRLTEELSGLREGWEALETAMLDTFLPIMDSDPDWARGVIQKLMPKALKRDLDEYVLATVLDLCERYDVVLPEGVAKKLLRACMMCGLDDGSGEMLKLIGRILSMAQNSARVAEHAWDFLPEDANKVIIRYMPLSRVDEILDSGPGIGVVHKLAQRKDVSGDLRLARRCVEASAGAVGALLRNGSAEVQRYLIESGKYMDDLVRVISKTPEVIHDGVKVPSPIVAKALATGSVREKQGMLGHLGRFW